ncbi:aminoacyl-tRNA hydrolase [Candidatus Marinamargulisbacteria bacterium SCGC AG-343-D04]|nr:aminoacyl-tRNA hydrolase [Candidatus Marinamargulisbacteria bacterium SCGC AG-343-D04]
MICIVCLGNPGKDYEKTRHNVGFRVGDILIDLFDLILEKKKFKALIYKGSIHGKPVLLIKPQTYMNLSGDAVALVKQFYKLDVSNILVMCDDFDIDYGFSRFRKKGGPGTHNGLKSVIQVLGTSDFPRYRIGIGPLHPRMKVSDFVLQRFTDEEESSMGLVLKEAANAVELFCLKGVEEAMNSVNNRSLI